MSKSDPKKQPKKNGGARKGAGRKKKKDLNEVREMLARIKAHGLEPVSLKGKKKKLSRVDHMMNALYQAGIDGNVVAMKEYMDRQVGKAPQDIKLDDSRRQTDHLKKLDSLLAMGMKALSPQKKSPKKKANAKKATTKSTS